MSTRVILRPGAPRDLERSAGFQRALRRTAEHVADRVRAADPTGPGGFERTIRTGTIDGRPAVITTDQFAHLIEWGSANNPPYAPFRTGIRTAGLRYRDHD